MMKKIRRLDKEGVSEVVGTILILSITVALFASIFATVSVMEAPDYRTYIDFESSFVRVDDDYSLTITHKGGRTLERFNTAFNIIVYDGTYRSARYEHTSDNVTFLGDMWGIGDEVVIDLGDLPDNLGIENWTVLSDLGYAELMVMDIGRNDLVWRTEFLLGEPSKNLRIMDMGVHYPHDWANFVDAGKSVRLYARVSPIELLNDVDVTVDISPLMGYEGDNATVEMVRVSGDRYVYPGWNHPPLDISSRQENGSYLLKLDAVYNGDEENVRNDDAYIVLNVGPAGDILDRPNVNIDARTIRFTPISPLNGGSVLIRAVVENSGGSSAICNVTLWDNYTRDSEPTYIHTFTDISLAAGGGRNIQFLLNPIVGSGAHNISFEVTDVRSAGGENLNPEPVTYKYLYVQPTILLVDDDKVEDGDAARMYEDLKAANFIFDRFEVIGKNGPRYDEGVKSLNKYDIVIWVTGSQTENTLTDVDQGNLETFLNNNGNLWLVGEGIGDDPEVDNQFLEDYLKTTVADDSSPTGTIYGNDIPLNGTENFEIVTGENYSGNYLTPVAGSGAMEALLDDSDCIAVSYEDEDIGYRTMFNSFLFSSIEGIPVDEGYQSPTDMVYKVINWLGDVEFKGGNDVAVAEQKFSTATPMYMDWVTIEAVIRNNGQDDLTNVRVALQVDEQILSHNITNIGDLSSMGGTRRVEFMWQADTVGVHEIVVVADPYNEIEETNLENNDIRYKDVNVNVTVRFSILVVDDDASHFSGLENTTAYVTESLDRLGYAYEVYTIDSGDTGPDKDTMANYNSIFWVCGHSTDTLQDDDISAISEYIEDTRSTSFFLMGNYILSDMETDPPTGAYEFFEDKMGIDLNNANQMTSFPSRFEGITRDPVGHGLEYSVYHDFADRPHTFDVLGADVFLMDENGNNIASRNIVSQSMAIFMGVDMFHLDGPVYEDVWYDKFADGVDTSPAAVRQELVYMITRWFGNVDDRVELRVGSVDITVESSRPMLRRSYLVSATIHNVGFKTGNALVRFKDGNTLIDSEDVYVVGNGVTTAEVSWQPLFAGPQRQIRVLVDPVGRLEEIGDEDGNHMGFNNHAMIHLPVYYFWDDMENGTANWRTEATIMNINAEHPLEFMSDSFDKIYTDVISEWDEGYEDASKYLNVTDIYSYSDPRSYWLQEPLATNETYRLPLDMGIMIDTTGSMSGDYIEDAKIATKTMIDMFDEDDRVALFRLSHHFAGNSPPFLIRHFEYMTDTNKEAFKTVVDGWTADGGTPLWDASGSTISYTLDPASFGGTARPGTPDVDYVQSVMLMTDGDDEHFSGHGPERGSRIYAPGCMRGVGPNDHTWGVAGGHQWGDGIHDYIDQGGSGNDVLRWLNWGNVDWIGLWYQSSSRSTERHALVNAPLLAFTVGLGIEPQSTRDDADGYMPPGHADFPFTSEFQLIEIAESTGGSYFYAPDSDELESIFEEIFERAAKQAKEGNVTSMPGDDMISSDENNDILDDPELPVVGWNYNKTAVTPTFDLTGYSTARLTFWHKYKIVPGMNGAFLQVGFNDENGDWAWKYVIPTHGSYTGNMNMSDERRDDFGRRMDWAWNGVSGGGSFGWSHVQVNILPYIDGVGGSRENVRVRFNYTQYGGGTGYGWFLDDVKLVVSRIPGAEITPDMKDVWRQVTTIGADGQETIAWWNGQGEYDEGDPWFLKGIDNSLITTPIDLTNALTANLSAHFKFNINTAAGAPPDGFRVEVTTDGGITWGDINLGVRTASGVSGTGGDAGPPIGNGWTRAEDLTNRLNVDLSDFAGRVIRLRFRVFTTSHPNYDHYEDNTVGFGGFYVDNVIVRGRTIQEG